MTSLELLSLYLTFNVLIAVASVFLSFTRGMQSPRQELSFHYRCLLLVLIFTAITPFLPKKPLFEPIAKIWSAESMKHFPSHFEMKSKSYVISFNGSSRVQTLTHQSLNQGVAVFLLLMVLVGSVIFFRDYSKLKKILLGSFQIRKVGSVSIAVHPEISIPFSAWTLSGAHVVIPEALLVKPENFRISVLHELQHHRQGDTRWLYLCWFLQGMCFWNPFIYRWRKNLSEIQEFACDESLVDRRKIDSHQYARCLIEVAQTALKRGRVPACATGMISSVGRSLLKRRIEMMMNLSVKKQARAVKAFTLLSFIGIMGSTVFASQGWVQDRRVTLEEANRMAENAQKGSSFPIVVNDLVLKHLNRYLGTKEGRAMMTNSLIRREVYRSMIATKLMQHDVPEELAAIPIIESHYLNQPESNQKGWGAGLWMFIKKTARDYGLAVSDHVDERLNPVLETEAAMRLLSDEKEKLGDWLLSVLAYNAGGRRIREAIAREGTRDPWELTRKHYDQDEEYLPKVMAAIIIMKNPDSL